jgi:hypothetical protein
MGGSGNGRVFSLCCRATAAQVPPVLGVSVQGPLCCIGLMRLCAAAAATAVAPSMRPWWARAWLHRGLCHVVEVGASRLPPSRYACSTVLVLSASPGSARWQWGAHLIIMMFGMSPSHAAVLCWCPVCLSLCPSVRACASGQACTEAAGLLACSGCCMQPPASKSSCQLSQDRCATACLCCTQECKLQLPAHSPGVCMAAAARWWWWPWHLGLFCTALLPAMLLSTTTARCHAWLLWCDVCAQQALHVSCVMQGECIHT